MRVYSTKAFLNFPCAHRQWFDQDEAGNPGPCARLHGYDRSFHFVFATDNPSPNGMWVVGFGQLKAVKEFLEHWFDHTTVIGADDPELERLRQAERDGLLSLRVLPYGASMEASARFVWERVNPFIQQLTEGRCWVEQVEVREHEKNSAYVKVDKQEALQQAEQAQANNQIL